MISHTNELVVLTVKMAVLKKRKDKKKMLPPPIYRFRIPTQLFIEIERKILGFIWAIKEPRIGKTILSNKRTVKCLFIPNFKLYRRAIIIKSTAYCQITDMLINRIELKTWNKCAYISTWLLINNSEIHIEKRQHFQQMMLVKHVEYM